MGQNDTTIVEVDGGEARHCFSLPLFLSSFHSYSFRYSWDIVLISFDPAVCCYDGVLDHMAQKEHSFCFIRNFMRIATFWAVEYISRSCNRMYFGVTYFCPCFSFFIFHFFAFSTGFLKGTNYFQSKRLSSELGKRIYSSNGKNNISFEGK